MAEQGSPLWWLERLNKALDEQAKKVDTAEKWYCGDHPVPNPPPNTFAAHDWAARKAFQDMARLGITNFLGPVVDVPAAKLRVEGFHFGEGTTAADKTAWTIWQRNGLDADSDLGIETALKVGQSYALVWFADDGSGLAEITLEDPSQAIVAYAPGSRRRRAAGLKRWVEDDGYVMATVYLPDAIYKYRSTRVATATTYTSGQTSQLQLPAGVTVDSWQQRFVTGEEWPLHNPLGEVPLVEISATRPLKSRPFGGGVPEFDRQINDQRRINQTVLDMLVTMEHQAFRQRWVIGWQPPLDKKTGQVDEREVLKAGAANLMMFGNEETKVGEFSQAEFRPFLDVILSSVKVIASTSSTPPYAFLLGDMINIAADSLARIDGQQSVKVKRHSRQMGERLEEVLRIALKVEGNALASDTASSVTWADPEQRTATEQAAVAQIMDTLGAPKEAVFRALPGVDQQEARRWDVERTADQLLAPALAAPPVPPAK